MKNFLLLIFIFINLSNANSQCQFITSFKTDNLGGPSKSIRSGNKLFYSAYDTIHGRELWCTDGTIVGTYMVKDINQGINNGIAEYFEFTTLDLNGIIYFRGDDGIHGVELWRSDGTDPGTYMVKDLSPGITSAGPGYLTQVNNLLFFTANVGSQLWRSDGTDAGTYSLRSFSVVTTLYGFNGKLYFSADDANNGQELWRSNGTINGTFMLKDLNGVIGASLPCNFHATPSTLYFMAATSTGWELWKTTGTSGSTTIVKDINPGGANGILDFYSEANMVNIGDTLYFRANDGINGFQLWKSDGTLNGTKRVSNIPNSIDSYSTFPIVEGKVFINNYSTPHYWMYDPAIDSTIETEYPSYAYFNSYSNKSVFIGKYLFYAGRDTIYGSEIFRSDGTTTGNKIIQETHLTDNWSTYPVQGFNSILGTLGSKLIFSLARQPYNTDIPLFFYDTLNLNSCDPPSIIIPVPVNGSKAHFVWNRIENTTIYEFRFRKTGDPNWSILTSANSFQEIQNLSPSTDYEYQVRGNCNGSWTGWSEIKNYNSAFEQHDYVIHILAEREENSTTQRIYWLKTPEITRIQVRYRPYGTTTWNSITNTNGFIQITGLLAGTFYEYQYRGYFTNTWDQWYPSNRYFVTSSGTTTSLNNFETSLQQVLVYPNPAGDRIKISGLPISTAYYTIQDYTGRLIITDKIINEEIDLSALTNGMYFLTINSDQRKVFRKFYKE